jgi:hypothetical protein
VPATIRSTRWETIQSLHAELDRQVAEAGCIADAAQRFAAAFAGSFDTVALARVFVVLPLRTLPAAERAAAEAVAKATARTLAETTPVLALVGTAGNEAAWNDRTQSHGHRAIPLVDAELVQGAPMIAELLASLRVELAQIGRDAPAELRTLTGGLNARFYVPDARTTLDRQGRHIIAARDFVDRYEIETVFGMGGRYASGALVAAILFTTETLEAREVDRFPSFISTFKMATAEHAAADRWFSRPSAA